MYNSLAHKGRLYPVVVTPGGVSTPPLAGQKGPPPAGREVLNPLRRPQKLKNENFYVKIRKSLENPVLPLKRSFSKKKFLYKMYTTYFLTHGDPPPSRPYVDPLAGSPCMILT